DQSNGCISVLSGTVNEDKKNPVVSAGPDYELTCTIEEVTLAGNIQGGTTNKTILWLYNNQTLQNGTTLNPVVNLPGSYLLVVTDNINGCTADDSAEVTENTNYPKDFAIDIIPPGCTKLGTLSVSAVIGGNEPYTYSLNGGVFQNSDVFESIKSGTYFINIKDANGCEFGKQIMVPEPPELSVTLPQLVTIEYGKDEILNPQLNIPESYVESALWTPVSGLSCGDCLTPFANPVNETTYSLIVTDVTGCTAQAKVKVIVLKDFKLYIPNAFSPDADGINDKWMLFGDPKIVVNIKELRIFDRWGEQMYEAFNFPVNDPQYGWDGKLRGKNLKPAVFVYYFEAEFVDGSRRLYKGGINLIR
ncbi:MAG TPA: gliding motility-associated C-terminal domain-containing protein, partial [Saprospiraceae bacterium]|nr:gliding motility-associated C-terminal domain-containing protein [Saprospiraceae bacterium]